MEHSDYKKGLLNKTQIRIINKLVVNSSTISKDKKMFRATSKMNIFFIEKSLKDALVVNEVTGYELFEAEGWDGYESVF